MVEQLKYTKELRTDTVRMRLLENGILLYTFLPDVEIDAETHLVNHKAVVGFLNNVKTPVLVDSYEQVNFTSEARQLIRELETLVPQTKRALLIKNLTHRSCLKFI